jgi:predicted transcriptional regulator
MTKDYNEILENLQTQKKQVEAQFLKIEGAIEIITSIKDDVSPPKKESKKAKVK